MAKVLVIPDMHGSRSWENAKDVIDKYPDYYVVGLGDWVDSGHYNKQTKTFEDTNYWPSQGENLKSALDWFRQDPEHRFFCIGNHDWSYFSGGHNADNVSGHQFKHALEIKNIFLSNKDILFIGKEIDGVVFSHAGFTKTWISLIKNFFHILFDRYNSIGQLIKWNENEFSLDFLNKFFQKTNHTPSDKKFYVGFDELLDWNGIFSPIGDEETQGPFWVRPSSLLKDSAFKYQIVGHTEICMGEPVYLKNIDNYISVMDSDEHNLINVIDTDLFKTSNFKTIDEYNSHEKMIIKKINDFKSLQNNANINISDFFKDVCDSKTELEYCLKLL